MAVTPFIRRGRRHQDRWHDGDCHRVLSDPVLLCVLHAPGYVLNTYLHTLTVSYGEAIYFFTWDRLVGLLVHRYLQGNSSGTRIGNLPAYLEIEMVSRCKTLRSVPGSSHTPSAILSSPEWETTRRRRNVSVRGLFSNAAGEPVIRTWKNQSYENCK